METTVSMITLRAGPFGTYLISAADGRDILVQTDWDFPGLARTFGWDMQEVQGHALDEDGMTLEYDNNCEHRGTDGTVKCIDCGLSASTFIAAAQEWLDDNIGAEAEDPGYFRED